MNQFFITVNTTQPKNNLEKSLQSSFEIFDHRLINESNIEILKSTYTKTLKWYKDNKGKCHVDFSMSNYSDTILIAMGSSLQVNLTRVIGLI